MLGSQPLERKRNEGQVELREGFSSMASMLLLSFYESSWKKGALRAHLLSATRRVCQNFSLL